MNSLAPGHDRVLTYRVARVETRPNILTPRISNRGANHSDTLALLTLVTGRSVAAQRPRIRPPEPSNGGGTSRSAPRLRRSDSVPPKLKDIPEPVASSGEGGVPQADRVTECR